MTTEYRALPGGPSSARPYGQVYAQLSNALARLERRRWAFLLLLLPPLIYLALLYAIPVLVLTAQSFLSYDATTRGTGGFTLDNYTKALTDPSYLRVLWTSLRIGFLVTALALVIGYPIAYLLARLSGPKKQILLAVIVSPLLVSIVIRTFSWAVLLRSGGPVNQVLMATGIIREPLQILNREPAVIIALVHVYLPFMIIPLSTVIESIDPTLELAASSLGANVWRRFVEVILPLSLPGIVAGCMLVLTTSVSAYVTPAMLSGNTFLVMPTLVQQQMQVLVNWPFGSAIAIELIVVVLAIVGVFSWLADSATKYRRR
jgi:putative spermidine/putrescine transport system permease protein